MVIDRLTLIVFQFYAVYTWLGLSLAKDVPAFYVFGDSLVDVGNNFYINTWARPGFPNGIDFGNNQFGTPSGRYSNGRTVIDMIGFFPKLVSTAQEVGLKTFPPPYLAPKTVGEVLLNGVNYASSGSGILNGTGAKFGGHISLVNQVGYFERTRRDIISNVGIQDGKRLLRGAIYIVAIGSNEVLSLESPNHSNDLASLNVQLDTIISRFRSQLMRLYRLDARMFLVTNCGAIGCIPFVRKEHSMADGCVPFSNQIAQLYNNKLKSMLEELNKTLAGSQFVYADIYAMSKDIIQNYISYGFEDVANPCSAILSLCPDRAKYVFWDQFHFTETANLIAAKHMMAGDLNYMSPMNVRRLVNS